MKHIILKSIVLTAILSGFLISCTSSGSEGNEEDKDSTNAEAVNEEVATEPFFKISLAEWSLHKALFDGKMTNMDFPRKAADMGIYAVEYVSVFFEGNETNEEYMAQLKKLTDSLGVRNVLIMVDREGNLGDLDEAKRNESVENHKKWVDAAKFLGCHSIRVNARGEGTAQEVKAAAIDGLGKLAAYGAEKGINVIVENHGGYSSDGTWLTDVMRGVNNEYCGTLPDFGNFRISDEEKYDQYKGTEELMEFAKGVSAKSYLFENAETNISTQSNYTPDGQIDYEKMLKIVKDAGYTGYIGIEYEGSDMSEEEGILATKRVLERVGKQLSN